MKKINFSCLLFLLGFDGEESIDLLGRQVWDGISRMDLKKDTMSTLKVTLKGVKGKYSVEDSKSLATSHSGYDGTYHGFDLSQEPTVVLDHIFVTKGIGVGPYRVVDEELQTGKFGSDHLPVITDIKLP